MRKKLSSVNIHGVIRDESCKGIVVKRLPGLGAMGGATVKWEDGRETVYTWREDLTNAPEVEYLGYGRLVTEVVVTKPVGGNSGQEAKAVHG